MWLVTPKQDVVGNHQWRHWRVVCCNVEDLNFGMQHLRPSNIKVIFQRPSCRWSLCNGSPVVGGFRFQCRYCPCGRRRQRVAAAASGQRHMLWSEGQLHVVQLRVEAAGRRSTVVNWVETTEPLSHGTFSMSSPAAHRAFQFGQKSFDSIRFDSRYRIDFFRLDSICQSYKFAASTLIFK